MKPTGRIQFILQEIAEDGRSGAAMKDGKWWVSPGILTSDNDPGIELSGAADQMGDEYTPMLFMTGDGHGNPSFLWATRGVWPAFFREIAAEDKLCCHVETFSDAVKADLVPPLLLSVFQNQKVFGWEPEVFKVIQIVLEAILEILPELQLGNDPSLSDIRHVTREMYRVHDNGYLRGEGDRAMQFWDIARALRRDTIPINALAGFGQFLKDYQRAVMQLRTGIHPVVASNIQKVIDKYPDHMHLISCGNAHIINNPLHRFLKPAPGTFGVVDQLK